MTEKVPPARRPRLRTATPVTGFVLLLLVYLAAGTYGAVRPGRVWLLVLAGVLFLVTVPVAAICAARRDAARRVRPGRG